MTQHIAHHFPRDPVPEQKTYQVGVAPIYEDGTTGAHALRDCKSAEQIGEWIVQCADTYLGTALPRDAHDDEPPVCDALDVTVVVTNG